MGLALGPTPKAPKNQLLAIRLIAKVLSVAHAPIWSLKTQDTESSLCFIIVDSFFGAPQESVLASLLFNIPTEMIYRWHKSLKLWLQIVSWLESNLSISRQNLVVHPNMILKSLMWNEDFLNMLTVWPQTYSSKVPWQYQQKNTLIYLLHQATKTCSPTGIYSRY